MGGIGYLYGQSKVYYHKSKHHFLHYWPAELYTSVPCRSKLPWGQLSDEGFHQMLIWRWDFRITLDIVGHWLDLMNVEGWIPREQILGLEALRSKNGEEEIIPKKEQVEFKLVPKVCVYRTIVDPKSRVEIVCAEQVVGVYARQAMMMLRNVPAYAASEKLVEIATELELELVLISELAEESSSPPLMWPRSCRRNQMSSSELVILDTGTCPALLHHIHDNENGVEARALDERSVCLNASCSEDLLSLERVVKLLGWLLSCQVEIMNFTGRTFVKSSLVPNERLYRQGRELSSSHQRRNSKWTRQSRSLSIELVKVAALSPAKAQRLRLSVLCGRALSGRVSEPTSPADSRSFTGGSRLKQHHGFFTSEETRRQAL
ncbi:hypothetical protein IGI04_040380 [Brassica rapa subsp. trilocularis]|uniref:Glycosyl hydrolase family 63 C-terminal domain-containing protein n=1 Tax=Brassica rapa subsp. trilocularis TaxID=1813537 RepID=A0ABQ7KNI5_BRACM|nr:hypothetical protein IGI04_040380 [Brassica rapa subsp. trilocularis]